MAHRQPRPSGGLENDVLTCLAAAARPMTVNEVLRELDDGLAYTTVMTAMSRLHAKQALTRTQQGRAYVYELSGGTAGAQANVTAHRMQRLLDGETDRTRVLSRFVDGLDPDSEQILRELLAAHPEPVPDTKPVRGRTRKRR